MAEGRIELMSPFTSPSHCKSCGAAIKWAKTRSHSNMPLDALSRIEKDENGTHYVLASGTHWVTCPEARSHRRKHP